MPRTIKMATNRINAQKSTGPKSAEGKQTVSRNAIKHGLSGSVSFSEHERIRIDFYTNAFLDDCDVTSEQSWMAREAAEAQVTLERIKGLTLLNFEPYYEDVHNQSFSCGGPRSRYST